MHWTICNSHSWAAIYHTYTACTRALVQSSEFRVLSVGKHAKHFAEPPILHLCTITTAHCYLLTRHFSAGYAEPERSARTKSSAAWLQGRTLASSGASTQSVRMPLQASSLAHGTKRSAALPPWPLAPLEAEAPASTTAAPIMEAGTRHIRGSTSQHLHDTVGTTKIAGALKRLRRNMAAGIDGIRAGHLLDDMSCCWSPWLLPSYTFTLLLNGVPDCLFIHSFILESVLGPSRPIRL